MALRDRWTLTAALGLPLVTITIYLVWIWPWPTGSTIADLMPYALSILTGVPFVLRLTRHTGPEVGITHRRGVVLVAFFLSGFVMLWIYAIAVLCRVHNVCL